MPVNCCLKQFEIDCCSPEHIPVCVLSPGASSWNFTFVSQLQAKFEHLKRVHQEERIKLEEKRRILEAEIIAFSKKKVASEILQNQSFLASGIGMKKDKDHKKKESLHLQTHPAPSVS